jgi:flavin-dependent thymidylate synthase
MQVTLISHTPDAEALLIFTKGARLGLSPARLEEIRLLAPERRAAELAYMAETIPSSWEFVDYVFCVEGVSRAYTHQQVRTRTGSYAQQSLRVVNKSEFDYVFPDRPMPGACRHILESTLGVIKNTYQTLVERGVSVEDARGILPTNIATNIVCKFNLRTMSELAASRTGGRTQSEYQAVVSAMCDEVLRVHPWAAQFLFPRERNYFDDIEAFAERVFGGDLVRKGELLKIVDKMRKEREA